MCRDLAQQADEQLFDSLLVPPSFCASPDRCQSGCSPLQSGRDRYSQWREQQYNIRGKPSAGRDPCLCACHHWRGSYKGKPGTGSWQFLQLLGHRDLPENLQTPREPLLPQPCPAAECRQLPASPSSNPNSFSLPPLQIPLIQKATGAQA